MPRDQPHARGGTQYYALSSRWKGPPQRSTVRIMPVNTRCYLTRTADMFRDHALLSCNTVSTVLYHCTALCTTTYIRTCPVGSLAWSALLCSAPTDRDAAPAQHRVQQESHRASHRIASPSRSVGRCLTGRPRRDPGAFADPRSPAGAARHVRPAVCASIRTSIESSANLPTISISPPKTIHHIYSIAHV